jgi:hypothetical protein
MKPSHPTASRWRQAPANPTAKRTALPWSCDILNSMDEQRIARRFLTDVLGHDGGC